MNVTILDFRLSVNICLNVLQEALIGFCYPLGTHVFSVRYNWREYASPASSMAEMLAANYSTAWNEIGNKLWYHDVDTGYVWVRVRCPLPEIGPACHARQIRVLPGPQRRTTISLMRVLVDC